MTGWSAGHAPSPVDQEVDVSLVRSWADNAHHRDRLCFAAARLSGGQRSSLDLW